MKTLIIADNKNFLDWRDKYPFKTKIINPNYKGTIGKGINLFSFDFNIKLFSRLYDVVFCEFFNRWASRTSHASSKPVFIRLHRGEIYDQTHIKTANLDNVTSIIAVSEHYKELIEEYVTNEVPITVIPNAIDIERFNFNETINSPLRICTLSNLIPRKRIFDLIVNNPDLEINIGGKGIEQITLEITIISLNLEAKLHGFVELPDFYHQHDVFIMNSSDESCGVSMIEAMSCGLIPFCYAWEGIKEILPKDQIYYSYDELREKLAHLNDMPHKRLLDLKKQMRSIVEEKHNVIDQTKRFIDLFEGDI